MLMSSFAALTTMTWVAGVQMRVHRGLVLAAQQYRGLGGETAQHDVVASSTCQARCTVESLG